MRPTSERKLQRWLNLFFAQIRQSLRDQKMRFQLLQRTVGDGDLVKIIA